MIEPEVLESLRSGLAGALAGVRDVDVVVGLPSRALARSASTVRVIVEDAGSGDLTSVDGAPGYNAEVEITVETYRSGADAADVRARVQQWMRGFYIRERGRHSGSWRSAGGWDIADRGEHRYAGIVFSARVFSVRTILDRLNIRHGDGQPLNLELGELT